jgi:hypothetical protein
MPEDVDPKERIPSLLAEWGSVAFLPDAKEAQAAIEAELKALGFKGDPAKGVAVEAAGPLETSEPVVVETAAQPKLRRTKT